MYMLPLIPPLAREGKISWGVTQWVWSEHAPSRTTLKVLTTALLLHGNVIANLGQETTWVVVNDRFYCTDVSFLWKSPYAKKDKWFVQLIA